MKTEQSGKFLSLPLQKTDVEMTVTGPIARSVLTQTFSNPTAQWLEAIYAFPLPENAAVDHMDLLVGERIIQGQIKEKQEAERVYTQAKQQGKKTALVQQHRPNLFTTSVANIPPGGEIRVRLEYQQQLTWRDQQFSVRFPMAITPRYMPADQLPATQRIEIQQQVAGGWSILPGEVPNVISLDNDEEENVAEEVGNTTIAITLNAGFPLSEVSSRYHEITLNDSNDGAMKIDLKEGSIRPDRDFELVWKPEVKYQPKAAFFTEEEHGLLMVMPPELNNPLAETARETLFIIDTSGSMGGASIRQAREALAMAIERLKPHDSFNVIEFNSSSSVLFNMPQQATRMNKQSALAFVSSLQAGGGTEMLPALKRALRMSVNDQTALQQVIFITDGAVGNERQLLEYVQSELGNKRLFTVGIGAAPNSYFMKEAAHFGRGTYSFISSPLEVQEKMQALFNRIESPVLTNLKLTTDADVELLPEKLPDLYSGEPVSIAINNKAKTLSKATLSGRLGNTEWQQELVLDNGANQSGLSVHWGREKIRHWMRAAIRGVPQEQVREEVLKLALKHHLVSQYTSLVAVDVTPSRPMEEQLDKKAIDGVMPSGFSANGQQTVMLASGATSSSLYLMLGLLLMILAMIWQWYERSHSQTGNR
ncbi:MAG: marine proteobacterial sortase target protein [Gammaproteobacteria bacterium]|nr:marine proteobacterial sortase target protein [Gammaproteobacteria bacterium]